MSWQRKTFELVRFAAAIWFLFGCDPTTTYRYTALTPAARPIPWDGRAAKGGNIRVEGTLSKNTVFQKALPQLHDTALNVPEMTAEGSISIAPIRGFEMGIRGAYSAYAWSQPSIDGTEPLPSHPALWGIGPEFKGTVTFDKKRKWGLGFAGNIMRYEVPYAEWSLSGPGATNGDTTPCAPSATCTVDPLTLDNAHYKLFAEKSESHITVSFGLYPSFDFTGDGEYGHVFGILGGHSGFENDGFTNTPQNGSTLSAYLFIPIVGAGYGIGAGPVHGSAMIYEPITTYDSKVYYGPGAMLTLGVDLELWDSKTNHDEPEKKPPPMTPPPEAPSPHVTTTPAAEGQVIVIGPTSAPQPAPASADEDDDEEEKATDQPGVYTTHGKLRPR